MNVWTYISALVIAACLIARNANAAEQPALVKAPVEKVFVPLGFDDNDDVEVIAHGHFPNTCYKIGPTRSQVDVDTGVVTVEVQAYLYPGVGCAQMLVPFTQSIKLGTVKIGSYRIEVIDTPRAVAPPLVVAPARTSNPDDFLYSPVATIGLEETTPGQYQVRLEGEYPHMFIGCMVMREVRWHLSPGNTLVILPIAELVDGPECEDPSYSYDFSITQPIGSLAPETYLLHTRVLDGSSLNRLIDLSR